jgi:hypothetical protein
LHVCEDGRVRVPRLDEFVVLARTLSLFCTPNHATHAGVACGSNRTTDRRRTGKSNKHNLEDACISGSGARYVAAFGEYAQHTWPGCSVQGKDNGPAVNQTRPASLRRKISIAHAFSAALGGRRGCRGSWLDADLEILLQAGRNPSRAQPGQ